MYHQPNTKVLFETQESGSQLWRRTWTPANSDMTDRETEYAESESDSAHSSDSEYVDSEYGDPREKGQFRDRPTGKRAPDSPTTFAVGIFCRVAPAVLLIRFVIHSFVRKYG